MIGIYGTVFNSANTVETTLRDLERKLPEDFIVVVSDNYSNDGTYEILKSYEFVDVFRALATRGRGRQLALEHLLKKYGKDLDFVFSVDFDVRFPTYFGKIIEGMRMRYRENEVYGSFASVQTYRNILDQNVKWPDLNMAEDIGFDIELILHGFRKYLLGFPFWYNEVRSKRETKYVKGFKYLKRLLGIYLKDSILYKHIFLPLKVKRPYATDYLMDNAYILFPEDIGLPKKYLAAWVTYSRYSLPRSVTRAIEVHGGKYRVLVARGRDKISYQFFIYRNPSYVRKSIKFFEYFHGGRIWSEDLENLL